MTGPRSPGLAALRLGPALVRYTGRSDGDLGPSVPATEAEPRRRAVVDRPWSWGSQVHGSAVVWANEEHQEADALITRDYTTALAVFTADCAPVALAAPEGVIGAVHAGWRGLEAGVVEAAIAAVRAAGGSSVFAALGPCIGPCCYEFSTGDLAGLVNRYGDGVRSTTRDGQLALDLPAAVARAVRQSGAQLIATVEACTSCTPGYFSHRARRDSGRQAGVVWLP
jgi:YfiH family protein